MLFNVRVWSYARIQDSQKRTFFAKHKRIFRSLFLFMLPILVAFQHQSGLLHRWGRKKGRKKTKKKVKSWQHADVFVWRRLAFRSNSFGEKEIHKVRAFSISWYRPLLEYKRRRREMRFIWKIFLKIRPNLYSTCTQINYFFISSKTYCTRGVKKLSHWYVTCYKNGSYGSRELWSASSRYRNECTHFS